MKSKEFVSESINGAGTLALRKVLSDFGLGVYGKIYSDKRRNGRRVKAFPSSDASGGRPVTNENMPTQQEVVASVARHFGGMDIRGVAVHLVDPKKKVYNDLPYIAVGFTN